MINDIIIFYTIYYIISLIFIFIIDKIRLYLV